jgi:polar amino acid transport system substrate-binding protein
MQSIVRITFILSILGVASALPGRAAEPLRVRADNWMPFNGDPQADQPGYVVEILRAIFPAADGGIDYQNMPWDAALKAVDEKSIDAVIGATRVDIQQQKLLAPAEEISVSSIVLFSRKADTWTYKDPASLKAKKLGVVEGYTYWPELDKYIKQADAAQLAQVQGDHPAKDAIELLANQKVDAYPENLEVFFWTVKQLGLQGRDFRIVYRNFGESFFVAFRNDATGQAYAKRFDAGMAQLRKSGELAKILARYGVSDWK